MVYLIKIQENLLKKVIKKCKEDKTYDVYKKLNEKFKLKKECKFILDNLDLKEWDLSDLEFKNIKIKNLLLTNATIDRTKFINIFVEDGDLRGTYLNKIEGTKSGLYIDKAKFSISPTKSTNKVIHVNNVLTAKNIEYDPLYRVDSSTDQIFPLKNLSKLKIDDLVNKYLTENQNRDFKTWYKEEYNILDKDFIVDFAGFNFSKFDFKNGNFTDCNFENCNFSGARMSCANFEGSNFSNAVFNKTTEFVSKMADKTNTVNFKKCNFTGARFKDVNLEFVDFSRSKLDYVDFGGCKEYKSWKTFWIKRGHNSSSSLSRANLSNCSLKATQLQHADLSGAILTNSKIKDAFLASSKMQSLNAQNLEVENSIFRNSKVENSDLSKSKISNSNFDKANLNDVKLNELIISNSNFEKAELIKADFSSSIISDTNFREANLIETNFTNAKISADVTNADMTKANLTAVDTVDIRFEGDSYSTKQIFYEKTGILKLSQPPILDDIILISAANSIKTKFEKEQKNQIDAKNDKKKGDSKSLTYSIFRDLYNISESLARITAQSLGLEGLLYLDGIYPYNVIAYSAIDYMRIYNSQLNNIEPPSKINEISNAVVNDFTKAIKLTGSEKNKKELLKKVSKVVEIAKSLAKSEATSCGVIAIKTTGAAIAAGTNIITNASINGVKKIAPSAIDAIESFAKAILPESITSWINYIKEPSKDAIDQFSEAWKSKKIFGFLTAYFNIFAFSALNCTLSFMMPPAAASAMFILCSAGVMSVATISAAYTTNFINEKINKSQKLFKAEAQESYPIKNDETNTLPAETINYAENINTNRADNSPRSSINLL